MEKRNTLLLTVIAVATLLVAVVGATFAYFATSQDDYANGNITLVTNTAGTASVFDAAGGAIAMDITAEEMAQANNNTTAPIDNGSANITVNFLSGTNNYSMTCTYDIVFAWDEGSDQYTAHSAGWESGQKEFTIQATRTGSNGTDGTNHMSSESEIFTVLASSTSNKVIEGATITNASQDTATNNVWTITANFYNLPGNQKELANKHYSSKFSVENVVCSHNS